MTLMAFRRKRDCFMVLFSFFSTVNVNSKRKLFVVLRSDCTCNWVILDIATLFICFSDSQDNLIESVAGRYFFFTVTVKPQLAVLFDGSLAEQLTGVVPIAKLDPEGGVQVTVAGRQLSAAVTV